jgi:maltooligosyltrehalose trehalohydrolase
MRPTSILMVSEFRLIAVASHPITESQTAMLGATLNGHSCGFRVWAPAARRITLRLTGEGTTRELRMQRDGDYFALQLPARAGARYCYIVDDHPPVADPVSRLLPEGLHGPTEIVDPRAYAWNDQDWRSRPLAEYIIYELHVGTFTRDGTFDAAIARLGYLRDLGITAIEIMPVSAFPGTRNWGYDGASMYAVQASYGGPEGLKRLVDRAHALGLAVIMDVVYNHVGNEGNYLRFFGPYFTPHHHTPWGDAINYDQPDSRGVRDYVIENARYWIREYHLDGLRLDAVQTIFDDSPVHLLAEIKESVASLAKQLRREVSVIAETDRNDAEIIRPRARGGYGLDALWSDDFHHSIHAFFTGERAGFYQDFGRPEQIVRALNDGFVFQGEPFRFWDNRPRGTSPQDLPAPAHVVCLQNHDLVGNRALGERWTVLVPRGARMLTAALLLLSPHTPLIFMGQEYDEENPFLFFTDYGNPALKEAVREGRRREFAQFGSPAEGIPDPQDPKTFERSKLNWKLAEGDNKMLACYRSLIALRKKFVITGARDCQAELIHGVIHMRIPSREPVIRVFARIEGSAPLPEVSAGWEKALAEEADGFAVCVYTRPAE